jgi:hypothetical protein
MKSRDKRPGFFFYFNTVPLRPAGREEKPHPAV